MTAPLRAQLRDALTGALRARDRVAMSALRSALAAIGNAEAVEVTGSRAGAIEQSPVGLAAAEVSRRELTEQQVEEIVRAEIAEREQAAADYEGTAPGRAAELRAQVRILAGLLARDQ